MNVGLILGFVIVKLYAVVLYHNRRIFFGRFDINFCDSKGLCNDLLSIQENFLWTLPIMLDKKYADLSICFIQCLSKIVWKYGSIKAALS
jgi:hypothetical protein